MATIPYPAILSTTTSNDNVTTACAVPTPAAAIVRPSMTTPVVTLNPSHTLAPLVAAAMAAAPVVTTGRDSNVKEGHSLQSGESGSANSAASMVSSNSFADALRHLARQQSQQQQHVTALAIKNEHPSTQTFQLLYVPPLGLICELL